MNFKKLLAVSLALLAIFTLAGCGEIGEAALDLYVSLLEESNDFVDVATVVVLESDPNTQSEPPPAAPALDEDAPYYSKDEVALYLWTYKKLPSNFITKNEAKKLGWEGGTPEKYKAGSAIGGDVFGNYEGLLPEGQDYRECDIDTRGKDSRGAKRIIYAEDFSAIYYTDNHYESFTKLYPEDGK